MKLSKFIESLEKQENTFHYVDGEKFDTIYFGNFIQQFKIETDRNLNALITCETRVGIKHKYEIKLLFKNKDDAYEQLIKNIEDKILESECLIKERRHRLHNIEEYCLNKNSD